MNNNYTYTLRTFSMTGMYLYTIFNSLTYKSIIHVIPSVQFRELCRIYNECLLDDTSNNPCNFNKGNESTVAFREWIQDYYGQVVVSQYTGNPV